MITQIAPPVSAPTKPLGRKAYGSIPHLPGSRLGKGEHHISPGQAAICTECPRDQHDRIWVQEKLDGSCVAVAKLENGELVALNRAGYPAESSPYEQHHLFAAWVRQENVRRRFDEVLRPGERIVGEWLAQAHGTLYQIPEWDEPFVAFDLFSVSNERATVWTMADRCLGCCLTPRTWWPTRATGSIDLDLAFAWLDSHRTFGIEDAGARTEGVVYRVERYDQVDFLAKWVAPWKVDGRYLPEVSGMKKEVWNWRPEWWKKPRRMVV